MDRQPRALQSRRQRTGLRIKNIHAKRQNKAQRTNNSPQNRHRQTPLHQQPHTRRETGKKGDCLIHVGYGDIANCERTDSDRPGVAYKGNQ